jgi:hypothetical protein
MISEKHMHTCSWDSWTLTSGLFFEGKRLLVMSSHIKGGRQGIAEMSWTKPAWLHCSRSATGEQEAQGAATRV